MFETTKKASKLESQSNYYELMTFFKKANKFQREGSRGDDETLPFPSYGKVSKMMSRQCSFR